MVTKFAVFLGVLAIIMVCSTLLQFYKRKITLAWTLFWSGAWIFGALAVLFVGFLDKAGAYFIADTGRQLVIYLAILVLFYLAYRLFLAVQRIDHSMSRLVEELAKKK